MNEENQYLVLLENEEYGPYGIDTMREMQLMTDTLVRHLQSGGEFRPAYTYPELRDYLLEVDNHQHINTRIDLATISYFYREDGNMYGPLSLWELSILDVDEDTELSIDNMQSWLSAKEIPGLIETTRQISGEAELDRINADRYQISLDKDELENVIKDQEEDLINKQKEIDLLNQKLLKEQMEVELAKTQPKPIERQWIEIPTFDFSSDYKSRYALSEQKISHIFISLKRLLPKEEKYVKVFKSHEDEVDYQMNVYGQAIDDVCEQIAQMEDVAKDVKNMYFEDIQLLDASLSKLQHDVISQLNEKIEEAVADSRKQIQELENVNPNMRDRFMDTLKRELDNNKVEITRQMKGEQKKESLRINQIKSNITTLYRQLLDEMHQAEEILQKIDQESSQFFNQTYDMASSSSEVWAKIEDRKQLPPTRLLLGTEKHSINIDNESLSLNERVFFDFLNAKNLLVRYGKASKNEAESFVTTLLGRLIASSRPGNVQVSMVDTEDMCGTSNILTRLNRQVYSLCVKSDDVRKIIDWMKDHIADIKVNLLQSPINTLLEYNQKKENKEAYQVLVIKGFPFGFGGDSLAVLNTILRNGINAGVNVVILVDEEELDRNEDAKKLMSHISDDALQNCLCVDFVNRQIDGSTLCDLDILPDEVLTNIVHYANKGFEVREDEKVLLSDYLPVEEDWWGLSSAHHADIPFGLTDDKQIAKLKITQESGQNSAVVIGIPGSGKSVFLHSVICNAIVNYSPDELNLYLIDFSGVEFNTYADHRLPHARVIAPEAERE